MTNASASGPSSVVRGPSSAVVGRSSLVVGREAWDRSVARASALHYVPPVWHLFYDGRTGEGDIYEDRTGLAISLDGRLFHKVSVHEPVLTSPWGTGSLRYLDVVPLPDRIHYYYECCRPDGAHELRLNVVPL